MDIGSALKMVAEVEKTVRIEEPVELQVQDAFPFTPYGTRELSLPSVINRWRYVEQNRNTGMRYYTVWPQVYVAKTGEGLEAQQEIAAAFHEAFLDAFDGAVMLHGEAALQNIRGTEGETFIELSWNDVKYIGLEYVMDLQLQRPTVVGV